jgi:hypothetical protein
MWLRQGSTRGGVIDGKTVTPNPQQQAATVERIVATVCAVEDQDRPQTQGILQMKMPQVMCLLGLARFVQSARTS